MTPLLRAGEALDDTFESGVIVTYRQSATSDTYLDTSHCFSADPIGRRKYPPPETLWKVLLSYCSTVSVAAVVVVVLCVGSPNCHCHLLLVSFAAFRPVARST